MKDLIVKDVTNDFCETYQTKDDCRGWSAALIPHCLPDGVDASDTRVVQIVEWCKELGAEERE